MTNNEQGYSSIIAVLVIGIVFLSLSLAVVRGVIGRHASDVLYEDFSQNYILAESCADVALLRRKIYGTGYAGGETLFIQSYACSILPILAGTPTVFRIEATENNQAYRLLIEVDESTGFDIVTWKRVPHF